MPRRHRRGPSPDRDDVGHLQHGGARREVRRGSDWWVREVPASRAEKEYRCPGCGNAIPVGTAHVVAWNAEYLFGDASAVRDRRHWHAHCWRLP